jgi:hypothetical protein
MTVTLDLKPETETGLLALAQASGMSLEAYLLTLVERAVPSISPNMLSPEEDAEAFLAWSASHPPTPLLSDYAVSRESMYEDRDPG